MICIAKIFTSKFLSRKKNWLKTETVGWSDCGCNDGWKSAIILDPFVGSGTTLFVAQEMGLNGIGIEINSKYVALIKKRLLGDENQQSLNPNKIKIEAKA